MNKIRTHERMCTTCSVCVADMYCDVKNTCRMCTPACTCAQGTCLVHTAKMHIHPRKHARATVQQCFCHTNNCNLFCNLSSARRETVRFHNSPWRSRSCVAKQASSDLSPWCRPHPVCLSFALALGRRGDHPPQNFVSTIFAGFSQIYNPTHPT